MASLYTISKNPVSTHIIRAAFITTMHMRRTLLSSSLLHVSIEAEHCYTITSMMIQDHFWKKLCYSQSELLLFLSFLPSCLIHLTISPSDNDMNPVVITQNMGGKNPCRFVWIIRQEIHCNSLSSTRVVICVVSVQWENYQTMCACRNSKWDWWMCRLIVRTVIESTYVGV